jgi:hypothetical protein
MDKPIGSKSVATIIRCRGNVFNKPLPSNDRLFWLYHSGIQAPCHNIMAIYARVQVVNLWSDLSFLAHIDFTLPKPNIKNIRSAGLQVCLAMKA